jgi:hypothetical protein
MQASQICEPLSTPQSALHQLHDFLQQRQRAREPVADLDRFEQELHRRFIAAEREAFAQERARFDVDVPVIEVDGQRYRRVLRCEQTSSSAAGPVRVKRTLSRQRQEDERALCPLGTAGRDHRRLLDPPGSQTGHMGGRTSDATGGRRTLCALGQHDAVQK